MTNTNLKIRGLAQEVFSDVCTIMRVNFNAVNQLFTIILIGLTGNKPHTQSSTIRSLIFTIKRNVVTKEDDVLENKILASNEGF